jgi:hypothetical protein
MLAPANCSDSETFFKGSLWMPALTEPSSVAAAKTAPFMIATGGWGGGGDWVVWYYRSQSDRLGDGWEGLM